MKQHLVVFSSYNHWRRQGSHDSKGQGKPRLQIKKRLLDLGHGELSPVSSFSIAFHSVENDRSASLAVRNQAWSGLEDVITKNTIPDTVVSALQIRNRMRHDAMSGCFGLPIPYIRRLPMIWAKKLNLKQFAVMRGVTYTPDSKSVLIILIPEHQGLPHCHVTLFSRMFQPF